MVPIGRGQRELIIGDRQTGKTAVASTRSSTRSTGGGIDKEPGHLHLRRRRPEGKSSIANAVRKLEEERRDAVTPSSSPPRRQTPKPPCSSSRLRRRDDGRAASRRPRRHALIIYDDLSKAGRRVSPDLAAAAPSAGPRSVPRRRVLPPAQPPARARCARQRTSREGGGVKGKTGSLTAADHRDQAGDVTAFIPTNVISITDGQIFLETDLFNAGIRGAVSAGISVSRVGGAAQTDIIRSSAAVSVSRSRSTASSRRSRSSRRTSTTPPAPARARPARHRADEAAAVSPMSVAEMALTIYAVNKRLHGQGRRPRSSTSGRRCRRSRSRART